MKIVFKLRALLIFLCLEISSALLGAPIKTFAEFVQCRSNYTDNSKSALDLALKGDTITLEKTKNIGAILIEKCPQLILPQSTNTETPLSIAINNGLTDFADAIIKQAQTVTPETSWWKSSQWWGLGTSRPLQPSQIIDTIKITSNANSYWQADLGIIQHAFTAWQNQSSNSKKQNAIGTTIQILLDKGAPRNLNRTTQTTFDQAFPPSK